MVCAALVSGCEALLQLMIETTRLWGVKCSHCGCLSDAEYQVSSQKMICSRRNSVEGEVEGTKSPEDSQLGQQQVRSSADKPISAYRSVACASRCAWRCTHVQLWCLTVCSPGTIQSYAERPSSRTWSRCGNILAPWTHMLYV
jgi:hypothetical protein